MGEMAEVEEQGARTKYKGLSMHLQLQGGRAGGVKNFSKNGLYFIKAGAVQLHSQGKEEGGRCGVCGVCRGDSCTDSCTDSGGMDRIEIILESNSVPSEGVLFRR